MEKPEEKPKKDREKELVIEVYLFSDGSSRVKMFGLETLDLYDINTAARSVDLFLDSIFPKLLKHPWEGWPAHQSAIMARFSSICHTSEEKGTVLAGLRVEFHGTIIETWRMAATLTMLINDMRQYCKRISGVLNEQEDVASSHYYLSLNDLLDGTGVTPSA